MDSNNGDFIANEGVDAHRRRDGAACRICYKNHYTATHLRLADASANDLNGAYGVIAHAAALIPAAGPAILINNHLLEEESTDGENEFDYDRMPKPMDHIESDDESSDNKGDEDNNIEED